MVVLMKSTLTMTGQKTSKINLDRNLIGCKNAPIKTNKGETKHAA